MNNVAIALKAAGVKLPSQNQRIWQWLKDNGQHTLRDVASETKIGEATAQAAVTNLIHRGMLKSIKRTDVRGKRLNATYEALGREYELLPRPVKGAVSVAPQEKVAVAAVAAPTFNPEEFLGDLTLSQLRQVYNYLRGMLK